MDLCQFLASMQATENPVLLGEKMKRILFCCDILFSCRATAFLRSSALEDTSSKTCVGYLDNLNNRTYSMSSLAYTILVIH